MTERQRKTEKLKDRKTERQKDTLIWKWDYQQFSMKLAILIVCVEDKKQRKLNEQTKSEIQIKTQTEKFELHREM